MKTPTEHAPHKMGCVHRIVQNPYLQFSVGLILLLTTLFDGLFLKFHHSIILLALWHMAQLIPNILQTLGNIFDAFEKILQRKRRS